MRRWLGSPKSEAQILSQMWQRGPAVGGEEMWRPSRRASAFWSYFDGERGKIRMYKSNNNSEQTVGQDSKATQDALITARIN